MLKLFETVTLGQCGKVPRTFFFCAKKLTAAFILIGVLSSGYEARAVELERVRVSIIPSIDAAPLFSAIHNGYFRDVGLEVDPSPSAGGAVGIPGLIGGSYDIAYSNVVSTLLAHEQGLDIRVVAPGTSVENAATDTTPLIARGDSGIKSGKDLRGKIVAVNTRNNIIWLYLRAWIKAAGIDPDSVTYKEVPFPLMDDALQQGRVDAAFLPAPFSVLAVNKGRTVLGRPFSDIQLGVNVGQYVTTQRMIAAKPATIERFVTALRRGAEWFNANRTNDQLLAIIADYTKTDKALLRLLPELQPAPLQFDLDQIRKTMDLMIAERILAKPTDLSLVIATSSVR